MMLLFRVLATPSSAPHAHPAVFWPRKSGATVAGAVFESVAGKKKPWSDLRPHRRLRCSLTRWP